MDEEGRKQAVHSEWSASGQRVVDGDGQVVGGWCAVCSGGLGRRRRVLMDEAEQGWQTVEQLSCGRRAE